MSTNDDAIELDLVTREDAEYSEQDQSSNLKIRTKGPDPVEFVELTPKQRLQLLSISFLLSLALIALGG